MSKQHHMTPDHDQLTCTVWRCISDQNAFGFFFDLLQDCDGPEVAESLREWFLDEFEAIEWDEDTPAVLRRLLQDAVEGVDWDLVARKWRDLVTKVEEFQSLNQPGGE